MRKAAIAGACVVLVASLAGCDVMNYIWQRIVGISYGGIDFAAIQNIEGSMSGTNIAGSKIPGNSVMAYKTRGGFLGKIGVLISGTDLTIECTTYNADGTVKVQVASLTIHSGGYCDLEAGTEVVSLGASYDFQWRADSTLVPQSPAVFYVYP